MIISNNRNGFNDQEASTLGTRSISEELQARRRLVTKLDGNKKKRRNVKRS